MKIKAVWDKLFNILYLQYNRKTREIFGKRETYEDELNFHMVRFYFLMYIALVVWFLYIPSDFDMHQYPAIAVTLRFLLTFVALLCLFLAKTKWGVNNPSSIAKILMTYLLLATAVITGTSGDYLVSYSGDIIIVILLIVTVPFKLGYKVSLVLVAYSIFMVLSLITYGGDEVLLYTFRNVGIATFLMIFLSWVYNNTRYDSWLLHKKLSAEMQKNERSLITISGLAQKAEEASRAKSSFLAKMSHEIRTPMNAVAGAAEIALRENPPESIKEQILTIKYSSSSLLSIINDILDFSKIESGKMEIVELEYSFASLVSDVVSIIKVRMFDSRVALIVDIDANIPNKLLGDEIRIRQVLLNILSNAAKYTEKGSISFEIKSETDDEDFYLIFTVADTGRGLRKQDLEELFDDFVQFDLMENRNVEGTGLGLAITKSLVDSMEGTITAESELGKGSVFTVRLPQVVVDGQCFACVKSPGEKISLIYITQQVYRDSIAKSLDGLGVESEAVLTHEEFVEKLETGKFYYVFVESDLYRKTADAVGKTNLLDVKIIVVSNFVNNTFEHAYSNLIYPVHTLSIANVLNGKVYSEENRGVSHVVTFRAPEANVLIVDDIETNRFVAKGLLKPYEMRTVLCSSGKAALEAVAREEFDLILMDHMMPGMDGIEATKHIRDFIGYENVPIVVLTANAISGIKEMFLASGFDDCLFKPIDTSKLNSVLERWIPENKQVRSLLQSEMRTIHVSAEDKFVLDDINFDRDAVAKYAEKDNNRRLISIFVADAKEKIADINSSLRDDSLGDFVIHIHAMRGACVNIGADYLSRFAADLETAAKRYDKMYVLNKIGKFMMRLESLVNNLSDFLGGPFERELDTAILQKGLADLSAAIEEIDPDKIEEAQKTVVTYVNDVRIGEEIEKLLNYVLSGDYDLAQDVIKKLRASL